MTRVPDYHGFLFDPIQISRGKITNRNIGFYDLFPELNQLHQLALANAILRSDKTPPFFEDRVFT